MVLEHSVQNIRVPREVLCILRPQIGRREQQAAVFRKYLIQLSMSPAFYVLHMQAVVFQSALAAWVGSTSISGCSRREPGAPLYSLFATLVIAHDFEQFEYFIEWRSKRIHELHPFRPRQHAGPQRYLLHIEEGGTGLRPWQKRRQAAVGASTIDGWRGPGRVACFGWGCCWGHTGGTRVVSRQGLRLVW